MNASSVLAFILSAALTFWLGLQALAPDDTVTLDRTAWVCTDHEPDGCAEWRRDHNHEMPGSAKR